MGTQQQTLDAFSTEHLHADLKGRSVRGGILTLTSQGAQFVMQTVSTIVLARLLTPADFGSGCHGYRNHQPRTGVCRSGLSEATIQRPEISHNQVSTLFWINVAIGLGAHGDYRSSGSSVGLVLSGAEADTHHAASVVDVPVSEGFEFSTMRFSGARCGFRRWLSRDITAYIVAVPLAIFLAWRGFGYWAIVALPLTLNFTQMLLSWLMVRWIPGLPRRDTKVRSLLAFGGNVAASYLVFNANRSADSILIGWHWGAGPLGLYSRAYNLLMLPVRQLGAPARSVAVPAFSRVQA